MFSGGSYGGHVTGTGTGVGHTSLASASINKEWREIIVQVLTVESRFFVRKGTTTGFTDPVRWFDLLCGCCMRVL